MERIWLKNYPDHIPHNLPPLDKTLTQLFEETCKKYKNKTAFISFGKKISYQELKEKAFDLAGYLQSQGFKKGDAFVIQLPNLLQFPVSLWATILSGLTVINLNPLATATEMLNPLKETKAKGILLLPSSLKHLKKILHQTQIESIIVTAPGDLLNFPKKIIINEIFKYKNKCSNKDNIKTSIPLIEALRLGSKNKVHVQKRDFKDTLFIQYTGGTTGISKGVCLSQKNILSNLKQCEIWMLKDLKAGEEQALAALPLYHIFAFLVNGMAFFLNGFTNILIANPKHIPSLVKTLKKHPITTGTGVNTLFQALLKEDQFKKLDFSKWKLFVAGGMALNPSVQKLWESTTNSLLIGGYGLTEASPVVCCNRLDKSSKNFVGFPLPSTEIRIVDENNQELGINKEGELEIRGPQVMKKYYKQEEETKKVFIEKDWLKTGDIAKINEEGLVQILDRKKDLINISGLKVYPNEVEEVLLFYKKVKDAAVIGLKNKEGLESVKAFIVKETQDLNEEAIKTHCKKYLTPYKIPSHIEFITKIPKNLVGKALRKLLDTSETHL